MLDGGIATLGIDEHTAVVIDLGAGTLSVQGRGNAYWRRNGSALKLENDTVSALSELQQFTPAARSETKHVSEVPGSPLELAELVSAGGVNSVESLAKLVLLAQTGGEGFVDPTPIVEGILSARIKARKNGNYELADELRSILNDSGIEINDSVNGTTWDVTK